MIITWVLHWTHTSVNSNTNNQERVVTARHAAQQALRAPRSYARHIIKWNAKAAAPKLRIQRFGGSEAALHRLPHTHKECSIPTSCRSTTTLCLNSQCASILHSPHQPLPRGLVSNGKSEPLKPLRRMNNKHTRSGMQLRSLCFGSLQPWYQEQFKPQCNHDCPKVTK